MVPETSSVPALPLLGPKMELARTRFEVKIRLVVVVVGWERCGSLNLKHADMFALVRLPAGINIDPRAATGLLH